MSKLTFEASLRHNLPRGAQIVRPDKGMAAAIQLQCDHGHTVVEQFPQRFPPDFVTKKLNEKGWRMTPRKATCPEHTKPIEKEKPMELPPSIRTQPSASELAKRAKRMVYMTLEEHYDDVKKGYRPGWTDQRVASECDTSPEFVRKIREDDFGPLSRPSELAGITDAVELVGMKIDNCEKDARVMKQALDLTLGELRASLQNLKSQLDTLAVKNGWSQ